MRDLGVESREEETYRLTSPHLKQEEEGKFRCKSCNKLFSARKFVEKHLALKHTEIFGGKLEEVRSLCLSMHTAPRTSVATGELHGVN